jgi:osmotically-inducible protein OsmY
MARFLRRAARLLVTAGAMSAAQIALASPPYLPPPEACSSSTGVHLVGSLHVTAGQAHLEAMKVEMAWLGDLTTYQLPVEVEIKGEVLEVHGQVYDEAGHQHAMEVARQACYLPVIDAIRVAPKAPEQPVSPEAIGRDAREALTKQFGARGAAFDVNVRGNGQIILRGKVSSVEEKLMASRCLRGLHGCTAIVNCLGVTPIRQDGHTITLVTSDGRHAVHGIVSITAEMPDDAPKAVAAEPDQPSMPRTQQVATTPAILPPTPTVTLPSGLPQARPTIATASITASATTYSTTKPATYFEQPSGYATTPPTTVQPVPVQTLPSYSNCTSCNKNVKLTAVPAPSHPSLFERLKSLVQSKKRTETTVIVATPAASAPIQSAKAPEPPMAPVQTTAATSATTPANWPPAYRDATAVPGPASSPYQPKPLLLIRRPVPPSVPETPVAVPVAPAPAPAANAPASPPVIHVSAITSSTSAPRPAVSPAASAPAPAAARTVSQSPAQLRKAVQKVCGKMAREVRVDKGSDHQTILHVVADPATEQQLIGKLLAMPEITATNVRLEIHVSH